MPALKVPQIKKLELSRSDSFLLKSWTNLLAFLTLLFVTSSTVPILASIKGVGFPCYFVNLVDYSTLNLTVRNSAKHLTPTLFLEGPEMYVYIVWSFLTEALNIIYFIFGAVTVYRLKRIFMPSLNAIQVWLTLIGGHSTLYLSIARLWTLQLFVHVLSFKQIFLAAFVYLFHFILSYIHVHLFISRYMPQWQANDMEQKIPDGSSLEKLVLFYRPILANIQMSLLALEMLVFSMSVMMAVCNSFYILVSDAVFGAVNLFLIISLVWHIGAEVFLAKYLKHHVGFYIGLFVAYVIMLLPVIRYDAIFVTSRLHKPITINMTIIPIVCLIIIVVRIIRLRTQTSSKVTYKKLDIGGNMESQPFQSIPEPPKAKYTDLETDSEDEI
uniref:Type 3 envelope glycoprotein M n=1 Tax=Wood mouse herpesvirus TaxID=432370 RepID=D0PPC8_9GAMA|nr:type 3 envelope glycoprotein M [Wood mouse herpesvirus]